MDYDELEEVISELDAEVDEAEDERESFFRASRPKPTKRRVVDRAPIGRSKRKTIVEPELDTRNGVTINISYFSIALFMVNVLIWGFVFCQ